jgi:hypothetical protein
VRRAAAGNGGQRFLADILIIMKASSGPSALNEGMNEHKVNHSLENFLKNNREEDSNARCALVASRVLRADVDGGVWINAGAAIAHYGDLTFNRIPTVKTKNIKTMA